MLDKTPFYARSGGQEGDIGALEDNAHIAIVKETRKFFGLNLSKIEVIKTSINVGEIVDAIVVQRDEVAKHHSATHLLQSALKMVLGESISQAGSFNNDKKLRFDFTYNKAMTSLQIAEVEDLVNSMIIHDIKNNTQELPIEKAKTKGAIAMFGEKYGNMVRVVEFKDVSIEFCGGTHVETTSQIGSFYILKESGVSSGVRRIEAVCGYSAFKYSKNIISKMLQLESELKNSDALNAVIKLKNQIKKLKNEINNSKINSLNTFEEFMINDIKVIIDIVQNGDIKSITDNIKNNNEKVVTMLFQIKNNKVLLAASSKNTSIKAGNWIKEIAPIVGGGGGGRADFAQAGGKNIEKIQEAKQKAIEYLKLNISK
jgi:alanyl-tRNA synthetase